MASNWGDGPGRYGLGSTGCTLASRVLEPLGRILTNANTGNGSVFATAYLFLDTGEIVGSGPFPIPATHPHFPYGYAVEPDV